uniref:Uncharacterized protein n=1 Tax=Eutreptiella gymnastica TaxID=73025 RepID=A0A7S4CAD0_9EUGL
MPLWCQLLVQAAPFGSARVVWTEPLFVHDNLSMAHVLRSAAHGLIGKWDASRICGRQFPSDGKEGGRPRKGSAKLRACRAVGTHERQGEARHHAPPVGGACDPAALSHSPAAPTKEEDNRQQLLQTVLLPLADCLCTASGISLWVPSLSYASVGTSFTEFVVAHQTQGLRARAAAFDDVSHPICAAKPTNPSTNPHACAHYSTHEDQFLFHQKCDRKLPLPSKTPALPQLMRSGLQYTWDGYDRYLPH